MKKNQKGFTLIELLIVVAIIAILAAIAIPQFAQYRLKGYNASATSDLHNQRVSQEALFADWQRYGKTDAAAIPGPGGYGNGVLVLGPGAAATPNIITTSDNAGSFRGIQIPTGNGVSAVANTDPTTAPGTGGSAFTMISKHLQGDTSYGADSDSTTTFRNNVIHIVGDPIIAADCPVSVPSADNFTGVGAWAAL